MGQARDIMDRLSGALTAGDRAAITGLYAPDAVLETPDGPRIDGAEAIADYFAALARAFPDLSFQLVAGYEIGNTAIDEGFVVATHAGVLTTPDGDIGPTGRSLRLRECDLATVEDGVVTRHRMYFDQLEFLVQLGLADAGAPAGAVPAPRAGGEQAAEVPAG
ncbi:ester cyclase [Blastococcus sp. SYSU D01042]